LDPSQIIEIRELIKGFAGEKTIILSSHILAEVAATCNKVVIINKGRLAAQGKPDKLVKENGDRQNLKITCVGDLQTLKDLLANFPGLSQVREIKSKKHHPNSTALSLHLEGGPKARAALFRAIVQSGLDLLELLPVAASLEEVFIQVVTGSHASESEEL
jgi:ABC-2 type transport system ATP-binding protein